MKTKFFILVAMAICILGTQTTQAKILRVGYFGTPITGMDFNGTNALQNAHNAANPGDTLLMFPGSYSATFTTRLVVIGYGYFVNTQVPGSNDSVQVTQGSLSIGITLNAGTDSTILEGLDGLTVSTPINITIKGVLINYCNAGLSYDHSATLVDWKITRSFFYFYTSPFQGYDTFQNLLLENDVITASDLSFTTNSGCTGVFNNDIFTTTSNFNNGSYSLFNNIFLSTSAPTNSNNCFFDYNIAGNNIIPSGTGTHNHSSVDISTVFVGYPNQTTFSNDNRYRLAAASPASGAGENGVDCGIFGGTNPYRLSGIPSIPSFYKLVAPSGNIATTNPYTIIFSVRSNN